MIKSTVISIPILALKIANVVSNCLDWRVTPSTPPPKKMSGDDNPSYIFLTLREYSKPKKLKIKKKHCNYLLKKIHLQKKTTFFHGVKTKSKTVSKKH